MITPCSTLTPPNEIPSDTVGTTDDAALTWKGIHFTVEEIADPSTISEEKKTQIIDKLCGNLYYTQYYDSQRGPYDLEFTYRLADCILQAKKEGRSVEEALESSREFCSNNYDDGLWGEANSEVEKFIDEIKDAREDIENDENAPIDLNDDWDEEEFTEELREAAIDQTMSKDDSTIMDLIGSYDKFEIGFILSPSDSIEDNCISSTKSWSEWSALCIDDGLVGALGRMGYSLKEYRAHSGNTLPDQTTCKHKIWPHPMATLDQIQEISDNACAMNYIFMVYAQVSITDLINIDLNQPMVLSQYALASYNGWNGTFFDNIFKAPLVIDPKRAHLFLPGRHYSPDNICGLVGSYYTADFAN